MPADVSGLGSGGTTGCRQPGTAARHRSILMSSDFRIPSTIAGLPESGVVSDAAGRPCALRRVDRVLSGLLQFPGEPPRHLPVRLRQLQGDLLHERRGAAGTDVRRDDGRHRHGLGAAHVRTAPDGGLRARHVDARFYDAPSNPNTFGDFNPRGESFEGPPSTAVFAGNGFIYIAPDYLGLGDRRSRAIAISTRTPKRRPRSICWRPRRASSPT